MDETLEIQTEETLVPTTGIEPDLGGFDIVEENTEPTAADLQAQLDALKAEKEALEQASNLNKGLQDGFQSLAQQLQMQQKPSYDNLPGLPAEVQTPQTPNYQLPDKESFEKEFFTNPYDAMQKMLVPVVGMQQSAVNNQLSEVKKMVSRNNTYMNESNKDILSKYGDEVAIYASRLQGEDPWGDAVKQVRSNHFMDIMNEKVALTKQEAYEQAKADLEKATADLANGKPNSPVGTTELGTMTNPTPAKVKVTAAQMKKVKEMTAIKFGPNSGAETELMMYNYMKENNML